jgi:hypothetical protein
MELKYIVHVLVLTTYWDTDGFLLGDWFKYMSPVSEEM